MKDPLKQPTFLFPQALTLSLSPSLPLSVSMSLARCLAGGDLVHRVTTLFNTVVTTAEEAERERERERM